jgi:hypothetical protein
MPITRLATAWRGMRGFGSLMAISLHRKFEIQNSKFQTGESKIPNGSIAYLRSFSHAFRGYFPIPFILSVFLCDVAAISGDSSCG